MVYGDISRVVSVVCGGITVIEKHEVRDGWSEERGERRREVSVCCQIWVTRLFLTWDPTPLLAQLLVYADLSLSLSTATVATV